MPGDIRIQALIDHTEAMLTILEKMAADTGEEMTAVQARPEADRHYLAFLQDLKKRAGRLHDLLEEDVITQLIGLNNLIGPIDHLRAMQAHE